MFTNILFSQSIRKNYLEMTAQEKTDYTAALTLIWANGSSAVGTGLHFANIHSSHFGTNIHSARGDGSNFTSFHRYLLLHYELMLRKSASQYDYLILPYWDWRNDPVRSTPLPVTASNSPNFWLFSFLPLSTFTGWGITRAPQVSDLSYLPSTQNYTSVMGQSTFWASGGNSFTSNLESNNHNMPHVWVGGTMGSGMSPRDPIFFIHHCMVDKIWQDYEDAATGYQSSYATANYMIPHYNKEEAWVDNLYAQNTIDSRKIPFRYLSTQTMTNYEVWYAENGSVILDGSNGQAFSVTGQDKLYRYTAFDNATNSLKGKIYIGDYKRDTSGNIVPDNKGGFTVTVGNSCKIRAGQQVTLGPGTNLKASAGNDITIKIINTPNGL